MFHCTERLLLRPPWPEDWQTVYRAIADEHVVRNLARAPWPYSGEDARRFVAMPIERECPRFLIAKADSGTLLGCIGLDRHGGAVELGYWIARPHWGRGYATEAGAAVLQMARMLGHTRLVASHFLDNPASGRVLAKLGFSPTGAVRKRRSCARGGEAPVAEYETELEGEVAIPMMAA